MEKYKVVEAFEEPAIEAVEAVEATDSNAAVGAVEAKDAVQHGVGEVIELTDEQATEFDLYVEKIEEQPQQEPPKEGENTELLPTMPSSGGEGVGEPPTSTQEGAGWAGNHSVGA